MTKSSEELLGIADRLEEFFQKSNVSEITDPIMRLHNAAIDIGKSFSGSWLGYHANVYYGNFEIPPAGARFNPEWGLMHRHVNRNGTQGEWNEYTRDFVIESIHTKAGNPDLTKVNKVISEANSLYKKNLPEITSIISTEISKNSDEFLEKIKSEIESFEILDTTEILNRKNPRRTILTHDTAAMNQGTKAPPHMTVLAQCIEMNNSIGFINELSACARKAGSHLARQENQRKKSEMIGTNVVIGHGRSPVWKDLKDFIKDRINLPYDEFNRVPVAGITNIARLSEMLDSAAIAFIILTAEDEQVDGKMHARMNAIHEAGLFQGRLGFMRAIILLEEGCEEFGNIHGLGQIRFPKGNISAKFEDIRMVLEREELIQEKHVLVKQAVKKQPAVKRSKNS